MSKVQQSSGSVILDALKRTGFRFSPDAKLSVKDSAGIQISRVDVSQSLAVEDALRPESIVLAVAASDGGNVKLGAVSDRIDALSASVAVNDIYGKPIDELDAIDSAASALIRDEIRSRVADRNRAADMLRDKLRSESARRQEATIEKPVKAETVAQ